MAAFLQGAGVPHVLQPLFNDEENLAAVAVSPEERQNVKSRMFSTVHWLFPTWSRLEISTFVTAAEADAFFVTLLDGEYYRHIATIMNTIEWRMQRSVVVASLREDMFRKPCFVEKQRFPAHSCWKCSLCHSV